MRLYQKNMTEKDAVTPELYHSATDAGNWPLPSSPIRVSGDKLIIRYAVSDHNKLEDAPWGFRVVVVEDLNAPLVSMPWLVDMQRTVGFIVGKVRGSVGTARALRRAHILT